jgi:predicted Zn-dependent protease
MAPVEPGTYDVEGAVRAAAQIATIVRTGHTMDELFTRFDGYSAARRVELARLAQSAPATCPVRPGQRP